MAFILIRRLLLAGLLTFSAPAFATVTVNTSTEDVSVDTTNPKTFSHDGAASGVKGVLVGIDVNLGANDIISAVSYGGVALTRVQRNINSIAESGNVEWWFLGASVPQGTQTVSYNHGGNSDIKHAIAITLLAAADVEVIDTDGIDDTATDPSVTLQYSGRSAMAFAALHSGHNDPSSFTVNGNTTSVQNHDFGNQSSVFMRQTTAGTSNFAIGGTATVEDTAFAAVAVSEVAACTGSPVITDVDTDEILTATQANFTVTGTNFCTPQGAGTLTLRQSGNSKTISGCTWGDTTLTGCDMSGVGAGVATGLLYGSMDVRVTNNAAGTDDQAITVTVPSGTLSSTLSGGLTTLTFDQYGNPNRLFGDPLDLQTTSQVATRNAVGCLVSEITLNIDGSLVVDEDCTAFDWDFSRDGLYLGTVGTIEWTGCPPSFGEDDIPDLVFQEDLAIISLDVSQFFESCDEAITSYTIQGFSATTDSTTDVNGAVTNGVLWTVDDASVLLAHIGNYVQCGASGSPVRLLWANPLTNQINVVDARSCANNDSVFTRTTSGTSVPGLTLNSSSGVFSGTPTTSATTGPIVFRGQTATSLNADSR